MILGQTACCAINEIEGLSDHDDAHDAMMAFCDELSGNGSYEKNDYLDLDGDLIIPGMVTFTAVVGYTDGTKEKPSYGPNFAAYIKKHKLGRVSMSPLTINRINHPTHKIRLWAWAPSVKSLLKWWKKYGPEPEPVKEEPTTYSYYGSAW